MRKEYEVSATLKKNSNGEWYLELPQSVHGMMGLDTSDTVQARHVNCHMYISKSKIRTPVDMSVLVDSGIDCLFRNIGGVRWSMSELKAICTNQDYMDEHSEPWDFCKPRMHHWFSDFNFDAPLDLHNALTRAGFMLDYRDAAFKIIGLHDGYCWPGEIEG